LLTINHVKPYRADLEVTSPKVTVALKCGRCGTKRDITRSMRTYRCRGCGLRVPVDIRIPYRRYVIEILPPEAEA